MDNQSWPFVPGGDPLCPVPDWATFLFVPVASKWRNCYPLITIVNVDVNLTLPGGTRSANNVAGEGPSGRNAVASILQLMFSAFHTPSHLPIFAQAGTLPSSPLHDVNSGRSNNNNNQNSSTLQGFITTSSSPSPPWASSPATAQPPATNVSWPVLIDSNFSAYGYTMIVEAVMGYLLAFLSMLCLLALLRRSRRHAHRKTLFALLFAIGLTRGVYGHLGALKVATTHTWLDTLNFMPWFFDTTIPVNLLSDVLTAYVDFLLTFFWLQFLRPKWSSGYYGTFVPVTLWMASAVMAAMVFAFDYHDIHGLADYNGGNIYPRSLIFIATLMVFCAALHTVVVTLLLKALVVDRALLVDASVRKHVVVVAVVGFFAVVTSLLRGIVLGGRVANVACFRYGTVSLANPTFFVFYVVLLMNGPCLIICVAFFILSWRLIRGGGGGGANRGAGGGGEEYYYDDDEATLSEYSALSENDSFARLQQAAGINFGSATRLNRSSRDNLSSQSFLDDSRGGIFSAHPLRSASSKRLEDSRLGGGVTRSAAAAGGGSGGDGNAASSASRRMMMDTLSVQPR